MHSMKITLRALFLVALAINTAAAAEPPASPEVTAAMKPYLDSYKLAGVVSLFQSPRVVLAGWIHYLAFDLMVGLFIAADGARIGIAHGWLLPILFLTLMFGPAATVWSTRRDARSPRRGRLRTAP